jgi:predicted PurR-regulated permease PerM
VVQYYIIGMMKVMAILAVLNTAALYLIGVKHALFFGLFAALLNVIPYLGPFLGAILPVIFAFLTMDGLVYPFLVIICFTVIQLVESNFLTPKIVGSNVNLNALITFLGLLVGGAIWGVIGMILIIPTLAILKRIFELRESTKPFSYLFGEEETEKEDTQ